VVVGTGVLERRYKWGASPVPCRNPYPFGSLPLVKYGQWTIAGCVCSMYYAVNGSLWLSAFSSTALAIGFWESLKSLCRSDYAETNVESEIGDINEVCEGRDRLLISFYSLPGPRIPLSILMVLCVRSAMVALPGGTWLEVLGLVRGVALGLLGLRFSVGRHRCNSVSLAALCTMCTGSYRELLCLGGLRHISTAQWCPCWFRLSMSNCTARVFMSGSISEMKTWDVSNPWSGDVFGLATLSSASLLLCVPWERLVDQKCDIGPGECFLLVIYTV